VKEATKLAGAKIQSNSSSVTPATSANVSPITSRSCMPSSEQDLIDPPNSSMINSNISASNNPVPNANIISAQNSISSVSGSPLPAYCITDDYKSVVHSRSQSISQQSTTDSPQHQGKMQQQLNSNVSTGGQTADMQLKYENDRLKLALAQSSANAKKWEVSIVPNILAIFIPFHELFKSQCIMNKIARLYFPSSNLQYS
jgi:homer protein